MKKNQTKIMVGTAMFAALAYGVTFVFRIPVGFLTFDAKDAVIAIASFLYGPISAVSMALIAALLELITVSGTGLYGFLMNFTASAVFGLTAALIYSFKRNLGGALLALYSASVAMTAVMMLMNLWITPIYTGVETSDVVAMIPTLLLPFNLAKALMNSAIAMFLYKPFSEAIKRVGLAPKKPTRPGTSTENQEKTQSDPALEAASLTGQSATIQNGGFDKKSTVVMAIAALVTLACAIVIFFLLKR